MYDVQYQYSYLLLGISFLAVWVLFYIWRRDIRKKMRTMSTIVAVLGPIADTVYVQDWWSPLIVTSTTIGFEPVLAGFAIGGVASALYQSICRKPAIIRNRPPETIRRSNIEFMYLVASMILLLFSCFYLLDLNSLESTVVAAIIPLGIMYMRRSDLLPVSLISGCLLVVVASLVYTFVEILTPGWVQALWNFNNVPEIIIMAVPIDDIIFYFLTGAVIGPIYEYWKGTGYFLASNTPQAQHV